MKSRIIWMGALVIGFGAAVGCTKDSETTAPTDTTAENVTAEHPNDVPLSEEEIDALKNETASFDDALAKIESYRDTIRDAIAADEPPKSHRPLDELDVVLEHVPTAARNSQIPRSQWETINTTAQQIREMFNRVHAQIDAGESPNYDAVSDEIEAAIAKLRGAQAAG